jgi:hypothetical protein
MKSLILALSILSAVPAMGSSTICAGDGVYYSSTRADFGTPPPPGRVIGTYTLVYDGAVLEKYEIVSNLGQFHVNQFDVEIKKKEVLKTEGPMVNRTTIYRASLTITKANGGLQELPNGVESIVEDVICRQIQRFLP